MPYQETASIEVPLWVWGHMSTIAEKRGHGCTVADLLVEAIGTLGITPGSGPGPVRPDVMEQSQLTDAEFSIIWEMTLANEPMPAIMRRTGRSRNAINHARTLLGLVHVGPNNGGRWEAVEQ